MTTGSKKAPLQAVILGKVSLKASFTAMAGGVTMVWLTLAYDRHLRVNHNETYSLGGGQHINGIESFWRFSKRRLRYFNGMAKYIFVLHLRECEWRWNRNDKELEKILLKLFET